MLSIGWPEMMIVAAAALIIVGPRDLPALLRNIGRVVGQARRMGNEFRAEINKVAALDDVKDIKKSITQPLAQTRTEIEREFNKLNANGSVEPSGALKPSDPKVESVYDQIKSASAKQEDVPDPAAAAKASMAAAMTRVRDSKIAESTEEKNHKPAATAEGVKAKPKAKAPARPVAKAKAVQAKSPKGKATGGTVAGSKTAATKPRAVAAKAKPAPATQSPKAKPKTIAAEVAAAESAASKTPAARKPRAKKA